MEYEYLPQMPDERECGIHTVAQGGREVAALDGVEDISHAELDPMAAP